MPVQRERDRAGQHLLFQAGVCSKLAKKGGDALSDLAHRDVERVGATRRLMKLEPVASLSRRFPSFGPKSPIIVMNSRIQKSQGSQ